jgi:hypothetical protein
MITSPFAQSKRRGWSFIQVLACLVAAAAGVWLGAYYVGVHVHDLAYTALDESTVLEKLPDEWRPEPPPTLVRDEKAEQEAARAQTEALQQELETLKQGIANLQPNTTSKLETSEEPAASAADTQPLAAATLAYWNRLREIAAETARLAIESEKSFDELNASRILTLRGRLFQYGADAIESLDRHEVDSRALELGESLHTWYQHRAELNENALALWQGQTQGKKGLNNSIGLTAAQQQFDQESALLRNNAAELGKHLARQYGVEFPPLEL